MTDARIALKTHGKPVDEIKGTSVNLAEEYEEEDRIRLALQHFKYQQEKWQRGIYECLERQDKAITQLTIELDEIGHTTKQLKMHSRMVSTQCEQIAKTRSLVLDQANFKGTIVADIVTRRGSQVQRPKGPDWYEEEQARKRMDTQEMSQEEEDLVDPQDDIELPTHMKKILQDKEGQEREADDEELNDSDAEIVDENQKEDELNHSQQEEVAPVKEKQVKQPQKKKKISDKPIHPPKVK